MAYSYPGPNANSDRAASATSLVQSHSHIGHGSPGKNSRKSSEQGFDVIKEFKYKVEEDGYYVDFFHERIRIEEQYISSLSRLLDKATAVDSLHDDASKRGPKESSRKAWYEVRDYTSVEIQSRMALVGALKNAVVPELVQLKEEQTRIRTALKDNIKHAHEMYDEHAREKLPKLKRSYWNKCQQVEDHKRQEHAIAMQARLLSTPSPTSPAGTPLHEHPNAMTFQPTHSNLSPPTSTPPLAPLANPAVASTEPISSGPSFFPPPPAHPASSANTGGNISFAPNTSSGKSSNPTNNPPGGPGRNRAGSAGQSEKKDPKDVLNDIAQQGKKGFNAIMQKLGGDRDSNKDNKDDGGFIVIGSGGQVLGGTGTGDNDPFATGNVTGQSGLQRRGTGSGHRGSVSKPGGETNTMRGVKIKREADEADKAYREGVFKLETLRLRREKLQSSAVTNLETFNNDLNIKLHTALERYIDALHGTAATNAQSTEPARRAVEEVNHDQDMTIFRNKIRAASKPSTAPVPYENFYVGPCRSLIFGVSLTDYDFARGEGGDRGRPPVIVEKCVAAIDERGLDAEGIYRISGRKAGVQKMIQDIELDEEKFMFTEKDDVFSISNVLKQYLRELPDPVFPLPQPERVKYTENRESHISSNFSALRGRLRRLPPIHQTTFRTIIEHLGRIQSRSVGNKMDAKNLAVVFNSVLFGQDQLPSDGNVLNMHLEKDTVLEDLITYSDLLFRAEEPTAPTLPPGSGLSRAGVMTYHPTDDGPIPGSSRTKFKVLDPAPEPRTPIPTEEAFAPAVLTQTPEKTARSLEGGAAGAPDINIVAASPIVAHNVTVPGASGTVFTSDEDLELLFDPSVIPASLRESVGSEYHVRPLSSTDLMRSHFGLLSTLTSAPGIAPSLYKSLFQHLQNCPQTYYILVIISKATDQLVAAGTLFVEQKHIHGGSRAGHIEDIVVSPETRGKGLGLKLVSGLRELGVGLGCYKTTLDCKEDKVPFYEKCGFKTRGIQMTYYIANSDHSPFMAPSAPPPQILAKHGSNLALPGLQQNHEIPGTIDLASERSITPMTYDSETDAGAPMTYTFPPAPTTTSTRQSTDPNILGNVPIHNDPEMAAWAADEGLGNVELRHNQARKRTTSSGFGVEVGRTETPLPPGAAPPDLEAEPERIKGQQQQQQQQQHGLGEPL